MRTTAIMLTVGLLLGACSKKQEYDATGIFEATTVTVSAETQGRILEFPLSEGDSVAIGTPICQIDTVMLSLQQLQTGSQATATASTAPDIDSQAASLRAEIVHQQNELRRQHNLLAEGATTQKTYDDTRARLATLQGQLQALLSSLQKNRTSISDNTKALGYRQAQVSDQISRSRILSPLTGTVLEKYAEPGEYAVPGKPLVKIADLNNIYLRSYFTAKQLADLKIGQKVTVIADFGGGETLEYPGRIVWIAQESEFTPKSIQTEDSRANLVYAVKVSVHNDGRLKLGQYGEVRL